SGEGVVLRFSGRGKVVICSRNRNAFSAWIRGGAASNG
ncbi:MAG TPA: TIGR00266 family protein, partial [Candidatus Competibacteraceae bacterium]|nr:TIGR00266 family protein [Candidatus Competibacteraceae bacterium]